MNLNIRSPGFLKEIFLWAMSIFSALAAALLIRAYIFEPVMVQGHSMDTTLNDGQRLFEYKLGYKFSKPERGDIIVLNVKEGDFNILPIPDPNEKNYIKRIIAVSGDEIDIRDGFVYINGQKVDEPYAKGRTEKKTFDLPVTVPEGKVFVLGDNRERSSDSRELGFIDNSKIRGRAIFRLWPIEDFGALN